MGSAETDSNTVYVGIGASAGGLEALQAFFSHLGKTENTVFIVAQHLSPSHRSMLVELLAKSSDIPVLEAMHGTTLQTGRIYVTPPNKNITIANNAVVLHRLDESSIMPKPSVDMLFTSLSSEYGKNVIGVILSGTGTDGTLGLREVKGGGGLTIVQHPGSAKYDGMPLSSINSHVADIVLSSEEIGEELPTLVEHILKGEEIRKEVVEHDELSQIFLRLQEVKGVDFSEYKRTTIMRRLQRRMAALKIDSLHDYIKRLYASDEEVNNLYRDILIGVTGFFRDSEAFKGLEFEVQRMINFKQSGESVRIWTVGCATGEEAYSLAILIAHHMYEFSKKLDVQIFATDIDEQALDVARRGVYPLTQIEQVPHIHRDSSFSMGEESCSIKKHIRDMVIFSQHDITRDPPFLRLDLIACRNLLIYFTQPLQERIMHYFHYALRNNGVLFLGKSETVGHLHGQFGELSKQNKLYRREYTGETPQKIPRSWPIRVKNEKNYTPKTHTNLEDTLVETIGQFFLPKSVVVNEGMNVVYIRERISLLQFPPGEKSDNVFRMIPPDLALEVRTAIHECQKNRIAYIGPFRKIQDWEEKYRLVRVVTMPFSHASKDSELYAISFMEEPYTESHVPEIHGKAEGVAERINNLEKELSDTKTHLQAVIEELETSNEELQSLNEELQSSNEELQSTNEEMETTNEELQSTNEELHTTYAELKVVSDEREQNRILAVDTAEKLRSANETLQEQRFLLQGVLDSTMDGIMAFETKRNEKGKIIDFVWTLVNMRACQIVDKTPKELIGKNLLDVMPGNKASGLFDLYVKVTEGGNAHEHEHFYDHDGMWHWFHSSVSRYKDGFVVVFGDITERKATEEKLREQEERFRMAAKAGRVGTWDWDIVNDKITWDERMHEIHECELEKGENCHATIMNLIHPDDVKMVKEMEKATFEDSRPFDLYYRIMTPDSRIKHIHSVAEVVRNKQEKPIRMIGINLDVTELKNTENLLMNQSRLAALGELLGMIAHQWRQPLNVISMYNEYLAEVLDRKGILKDELADMFDKTCQQVHYLSDTISDFKSFFSTDQKKVDFDVRDAAQKSLDLVNPQFRYHSITAEIISKPRTKYRLYGVPTQFKQVLLNIMLNARDAIIDPAHPEKSNKDGIFRLTIGKEKKHIIITCHDNGKGVTDEIIEKAFNPYFTTKHPGQGTGIGLYMCKTIIERHFQGQISMRHHEEGGAEVMIRIPCE